MATLLPSGDTDRPIEEFDARELEGFLRGYHRQAAVFAARRDEAMRVSLDWFRQAVERVPGHVDAYRAIFDDMNRDTEERYRLRMETLPIAAIKARLVELRPAVMTPLFDDEESR
jgi:hypothetical protein